MARGMAAKATSEPYSTMRDDLTLNPNRKPKT